MFNTFKPDLTVVIFGFYTRNSRFVVDEDDLKWWLMKTQIALLLKLFLENVRSKTLRCRKWSFSAEMQNYVLLHREGYRLIRRRTSLISNHNSISTFFVVSRTCPPELLTFYITRKRFLIDLSATRDEQIPAINTVTQGEMMSSLFFSVVFFGSWISAVMRDALCW